MGHGTARVVVQSIGAAGVGLVRSLRHVLPFADADIAALLFQAPSELLAGLERPRAESIVKLLCETGLDCAVLDAGECIPEGSGDHEVALNVRDVEHIPAVMLEVVRLLGVDAPTARSLICSAPAVLLGGISAATVEVLRRRFDKIGADLDASRPAEAHFDLFLGECSAMVRERTIARLSTAPGVLELPASSTTEPIAVLGLDHANAIQLWRELRQSDAPVRIVNRDFARYDVLLRAAPDSAGLRQLLTTRAGIPLAIVPRVLARLPIVIHRGLRYAELEPVLHALSAVQATAVAEPLAFQRFAVTLGEVREVRPIVPVVSAITGLDEAAALTALRSRPARLAGLFPPLQARWLQHELKRVGIEARLEAV